MVIVSMTCLSSRREAAAVFDGLPGSVPTTDNGCRTQYSSVCSTLTSGWRCERSWLAIVSAQEDSLRFLLSWVVTGRADLSITGPRQCLNSTSR